MGDYKHWRELMDCDYLRAELLAPKERKVLTIKEVKAETITSKTGETDVKPVLYFKEDVLPMVLNVTNCQTIERLYGTGNTTEWHDKKIQIFATSTKVSGIVVPCLRVEAVIPATDKVTYVCSVCGKEITKTVYDGSVAKYGKSYCSAECVKKDKEGEDLL